MGSEHIMNEWSEYDLSTGRLTGAVLAYSNALPPPGRPGMGYIRGRFRPGTHAVDLETGQAREQRAAKPQDTENVAWDWSEEAGRWAPQPTASALDRQRERDSSAAIQALELSALRALREHVLGLPGAEDKLRAVDEAVRPHREAIAAIRARRGRD